MDFPGSGHLWLAQLIEDPYNYNQAYLAGGGLSGGNHLFHLTAGNSSISYIEEPYSFNSTVSAMGYSSIEPNHRYVLTYYGSFYHSSDDGKNWQLSEAFDGPDAHYFYGSTIWVSPNTKGLRDFHNQEKLQDLLFTLNRIKQKNKTDIPLLLKVSPDIDDNSELEDVEASEVGIAPKPSAGNAVAGSTVGYTVCNNIIHSDQLPIPDSLIDLSLTRIALSPSKTS